MQIFPAPKRTLAIVRVGTIFAIIVFSLQFTAGLVGLRNGSSGWHVGTYAVGVEQKQQVSFDAQGNPVRVQADPLPGTVLVPVKGATATSAVESRAAAALLPGAWLVVLFGVYRLLRFVRTGDPFVAGSVHALRQIAGALLLLPAAVMASNTLNNIVYSSAVDMKTVGAMPRAIPAIPNDIAEAVQPAGAWWASVPWWVCAAALLVLVVAEVFAVGVQRQRDMEGLV